MRCGRLAEEQARQPCSTVEHFGTRRKAQVVNNKAAIVNKFLDDGRKV
jgi:hypothetical protein